MESQKEERKVKIKTMDGKEYQIKVDSEVQINELK